MPEPVMNRKTPVPLPRAYPEARIGLICLVLVAWVALFEFQLTLEVRLTFLYFLVIALGAWAGGLLAAIGVAVISSRPSGFGRRRRTILPRCRARRFGMSGCRPRSTFRPRFCCRLYGVSPVI